MGSVALEGFSKLNNSMGASHPSANNIWTGEQHFHTHGPRTAPRSNCAASAVEGNTIISLHLPENKNWGWTSKNQKKIHSELLSHLLRAAKGIVFYSVLSPPTKKQNSIVDLKWTLSKQQTRFIFQAKKDPPTPISNHQKEPLRAHKHFFSNRTLNSWISQWVKRRKLLRVAIYYIFYLFFSTLAVPWWVSFLFPLMT